MISQCPWEMHRSGPHLFHFICTWPGNVSSVCDFLKLRWWWALWPLTVRSSNRPFIAFYCECGTNTIFLQYLQYFLSVFLEEKKTCDALLNICLKLILPTLTLFFFMHDENSDFIIINFYCIKWTLFLGNKCCPS